MSIKYPYFGNQEFYQNLRKQHKMSGYIVKFTSKSDILVPNFYYLHEGLKETFNGIDEDILITKLIEFKVSHSDKIHSEEKVVFTGKFTEAMKWTASQIQYHLY